MNSPSGLVVPNIKRVEALSLAGVAAELNRLQGLAAAGKLGLAELSGGTISISNIGNMGGTYLRPVILPPESAIVALGKIQTLPRYDLKRYIYTHIHIHVQIYIYILFLPFLLEQ
jgi:2-oxoisovalerate dehydrogenase E2 component (dihydrolipoyl transacylase)